MGDIVPMVAVLVLDDNLFIVEMDVHIGKIGLADSPLVEFVVCYGAVSAHVILHAHISAKPNNILIQLSGKRYERRPCSQVTVPREE
jgi:hypothetical protein